MPRKIVRSTSLPTLRKPDDVAAEQVALDALLKGLVYNERQTIEPLVTDSQLKEEAEELSGSLRKFIPKVWKLVEPANYISNWHIDALSDHLEAVTAGDITYLLITMPPRHSKSLILSVIWPTWEWLTLPFYRWVFASYAFQLSVRDSIKRRKILQSEWYQRRFSDRFELISEQNTKIRYENNMHGFMLASSVGGSNTGEGGERVIADDPHNIKDTESPDVIKSTVDWWNIVMSTRRNDLRNSARIVVQQRTNEGDVAGDIIERGEAVHLNLPTEAFFGESPKCVTRWFVHATGETHVWEDPRKEPGELLNPARFTAEDNARAKLDLGDYQYASQHGQNPTPPSGTIIKKEWLKFYGGKDQPPVPEWGKGTHAMMPLLSLDCTFKEHNDTDYVAGLGWEMFGADIYLMPRNIHDRLSFTRTLDALVEFVGGQNLDKSQTYAGIYPFIKIKLIEDKANGTAVMDTFRHRVPGMVAFEPGNASKESRLQAGSWRFRAGNIYLPDPSIAPWVTDYKYELLAFPKARRDDYVDATSQMLIFIGGDPQVEGTPSYEPHVSRWMPQLSNPGGDEDDGTKDSIWGSVNQSIWRVY